jgi:transposase
MKATLQISFDWAVNQHAYSWRDSISGAHENGQVSAKPELFKQWLQQLHDRFSEHHFEVIVEMSKGALIWMLKDYDYVTIYPLNPICSNNFRKACRSSGAKDDPTDAELWLEYLRKHREHLRPYQVGSAHSRELDLLTSQRRGFVDRQTSVIQQLHAVLGEYYPQAPEFCGSLRCPMALAFMRKWPDPHRLMKSRPATLQAFYHRHGLRRPDSLEQRMHALKNLTPLTDDPVILRTCVLRLKALLDQLEVLAKSIAQYDQRISEVYAAADTRKRQLIESLPRTGKALGPRMLVALDYLGALDGPTAAATFSGVAPVTVRSGKSSFVHRRYGKPGFLHQTLIEFAQQTSMAEGWARTYYLARRSSGESYFSIMRSLAYKWLRILIRCWNANVPYDEAAYCLILKKRGSPYVPSAS